jgi:hypothetical protein
MSTNFQEVAKYVVDKLLIAVLVVAATVLVNYFLEKYKVSSSVSIYDSNEFMKRADLLWAKVYEVEAESDQLSSLYSEFHYQEFIRPPLDELQTKVDKQRAAVEAKRAEFWSLLNQHRFYLGEALARHLIWYVALTGSMLQSEASAAMDAKEDAKMLADPDKWPVVRDDEYVKRMKASTDKHREEVVKYRELMEEEMKKLRFGYAAARRYSLERQP